MLLLDAVNKLKFPLKIQLLEDLESLNEGQVLSAGEIITIYGFGRQLVVTSSSGHIHDDDPDDYVNMKPEKEVYIAENCCEKMKDIHCDRRIYENVLKIKEQLPRYLQAEIEFFTMKASEDEMTKVEKGQILEFVRIINCGNPGEYRNDICTQNDKDLVIYKSNGEEIILMGEIKLKCIPDGNEYSTKELLNKFSFPRKMVFVNSYLQNHFETFTNASQQLILDLTDNPRLFFTFELQKPYTNLSTYRISLFEVNLLYLSVGIKSRIHVKVITEAAGGNGSFELLFAKEKENNNKQGNFKTFDIYGKFSKESGENAKTGTEYPMTSNNLEKTPKCNDPKNEETEDHSNGIDTENSEITKIPPLPSIERQSDKKKQERSFDYESIFPIAKNSNIDNKTALVTPVKSAAVGTETSIQKEGNVKMLHSLPQLEEEENENLKTVTLTHFQKKANSLDTCKSNQSESSGAKIQHNLSVPVKQRPSFLREDNLNELPKKTHVETGYLDVGVDKATEDDKEDRENTMNKEDNVDITCDIKDMGKRQLYQCLITCGLQAFAEKCKEEGIDGTFVAELEDEELKDEPYFMKRHELRKFNKIKEGWRPKE